MTWLSHYIFEMRKGNKLRGWKFRFVFYLVIFLFNQSKNNAILVRRTGLFRRLVGFDAKDLSFETKDVRKDSTFATQCRCLKRTTELCSSSST